MTYIANNPSKAYFSNFPLIQAYPLIMDETEIDFKSKDFVDKNKDNPINIINIKETYDINIENGKYKFKNIPTPFFKRGILSLRNKALYNNYAKDSDIILDDERNLIPTIFSELGNLGHNAIPFENKRILINPSCFFRYSEMNKTNVKLHFVLDPEIPSHEILLIDLEESLIQIYYDTDIIKKSNDDSSGIYKITDYPFLFMKDKDNLGLVKDGIIKADFIFKMGVRSELNYKKIAISIL